jgi:copper chaperone CopZ
MAESQEKHAITAEYAVQMTCDKCVSKVHGALSPLGVQHYTISLPNQLVTVQSVPREHPPSRLLAVLRSTGLTSLLRGITSPYIAASTPYTYPGAAVCIFESFKGAAQGWAQDVNKGLSRLVQIDDSEILVDLTVDGLEPHAEYTLQVRECGDLSQGSLSTGDVLHSIGTLQTDSKGSGELVQEVQGFAMWQLVGRSLVFQSPKGPDFDVAGIIARSAGLFQNAKKICACSGKTLWEEASRL